MILASSELSAAMSVQNKAINKGKQNQLSCRVCQLSLFNQVLEL